MTVGAVLAHGGKLMRFQPAIAVWGDKFIDQMCEVCLPCVLAPNNLPAIPGK
jgi:hypothetical protein